MYLYLKPQRFGIIGRTPWACCGVRHRAVIWSNHAAGQPFPDQQINQLPKGFNADWQLWALLHFCGKFQTGEWHHTGEQHFKQEKSITGEIFVVHFCNSTKGGKREVGSFPITSWQTHKAAAESKWNCTFWEIYIHPFILHSHMFWIWMWGNVKANDDAYLIFVT